MEKIIGHIFGSLENSEKAINTLSKQCKSHKRLLTIASIGTVILFIETRDIFYKIKEQNDKIEALAKEIEEMKVLKEV